MNKNYRTSNKFIQSLNLSSPEGDLRFKTEHFRSSLEFPIEMFIGPYNTGKTKAAIDSGIIHAAVFPGAHVAICRGTLTALKATTLLDLESRGGNLIHSTNRNLGEYRLAFELNHPVSGAKVTSKLTGFGVEKVDDEFMGSLELSHIIMDEADSISGEKRDKMIARNRLQVYHSFLTVYDFASRMANRWNVSIDEALDILKSCQNTNFRNLSSDHPMPGFNQTKIVYNPKGENEIWKTTFNGVPYPYDSPLGITPEWVDKNCGVIEHHVPWNKLQSAHLDLGAGDIIIAPDGNRYFVETQEGDEIRTISQIHPNGVFKNKQKFNTADLVLQKSVIYAFPWENKSANRQTTRLGFYLSDSVLNKYMLGKTEQEELYVFPNFRNEYIDHGGHIIPAIPSEEIFRKGDFGYGGIDDGIDHACAAVYGLRLRLSGTLIIFKDYVAWGRFPPENAMNIQQGVPVGSLHNKVSVLPMTWGYDPSMDSRNFGQTSAYGRSIDRYQEHIPNMVGGDKGEIAFGNVNKLLERKPILTPGEIPFKLLIADNCQDVIETMEKLTWEMVRKKRDNYYVDVGDAIKLMVSVYMAYDDAMGNRPKVTSKY